MYTRSSGNETETLQATTAPGGIQTKAIHTVQSCASSKECQSCDMKNVNNNTLGRPRDFDDNGEAWRINGDEQYIVLRGATGRHRGFAVCQASRGRRAN